MRDYWEGQTWLHIFLTTVLDKCKWAASHPGRFNPRGNGPVLILTGWWMNPRSKRDTLEKKDMYSHPPPRRQNPAIVSTIRSEMTFRFCKM